MRKHGFAERVIESYVWVATYFERTYRLISARTLGMYRDWLIDTFKPNAANQRMQVINSCLGFLGRDEPKPRSVRIQYRTFLDDAIDDRSFRWQERHLRESECLRDYHAVRIMATMGVRAVIRLQELV